MSAIPTSSSSTPLLEMRGVSKRFGATIALAGVDLRVSAGEVHALVGENGAGKSTLMKILAGVQRPDAGEMFLAGQPYRPAGPLDARRTGVAMIYQELALAPHLSVEENILLGMEPRRFGFIRRRALRRQAREALRQLEHDNIDPARPVGELSIAQQQLVEIARAVAVGSRVVVLDEPTSSLGRHDVDRLFRLIERLRERGHAVVYISHFIEEMQRIAQRYTVLRDGRSVASGDVAGTSAEQIVRLMAGRKIDDFYPRSERTPGEALLQLNDFTGEGGKPSHASLELRRGEVLGIAGLIGAGRTELLRSIFGLDAVQSGEIRVAAFSGAASPARRWRQGVGMLSEDRKGEGLALPLSIGDNVTLSRLGGLGPAGLVLPSKRDAATRRWIDRLSVKCAGPRQRVCDLSGGNQQKVAIARLLHHDVDVLLLDEPTRGIDVGSKSQIYAMIDDLAAGRAGGRPRAVLLVSSYLPELLGVCDRIAVMCRGRLGAARPTSEWTEHQLLLEATGAQGE